MDRIFDKTYVNQVYDDIKSALKDAKECMEDMQTTANDAITAYEDVPSYAQNAEVETAATALKNAIENIDIDTVLSKLLSCKTRATALIPNSDSEYAAETKSLIEAINGVKDALSQMKDFMIKTSFYADPKSFAADLKVASKKWNKVLKDSSNLVDQIKDNIKGAEAVSVVFSKDPVNLSTGNLITENTDIIIGTTQPFAFKRFYNAINKRKGSLGCDWNHNYEVFLEKNENEIILVLEEGKEERFISSENGKYLSLYHSNGFLEQFDMGYKYYTVDRKEYFFSDDGKLIKLALPEGDVISLIYSEKDNRLEKIENDCKGYFILSYDEEGMLNSVTDNTGRTAKYEVSAGLLRSVTTPGGQIRKYTYGSNKKLEAITNPRGITFLENIFDGSGRTIQQDFSDGSSMTYEYGDNDRTVVLTERNGSKVTYVHDEYYRDIKHIYHDGEERFEYNGKNQKTLSIDKLGRKTQYAYDCNGNLTRIINALGEKTEIVYDTMNLPVSLIVNGEEKLRNRYDEEGNLIHTKDILGNTYKISYEKKGLPNEIIHPDGSNILLSYDKNKNVTSIETALGHKTYYEYNNRNQVVKTTDALGRTTSFGYDDEQNLVSVSNASGASRYYTYNESNKITKIQDFDGSSISQEYNKLGKPSRIIDQMGRPTIMEYDSMWNLTRLTAANGAKTSYVYNCDNLLERIRQANGSVIRYAYDKVGNRINMTDEEGYQTTFVYDALNRIVEIRDNDGTKQICTYDSEGNISTLTDAAGATVKFEYDRLGHLINEVNSSGETRKYTYNSMGLPDTKTDEAGRATKYEYLPGGLLHQITYEDKTTELYSYNEVGKVSAYTDRAGNTLTYKYDELDQVIQIIDMEQKSKKYEYDLMGRIVSAMDEMGSTTKYSYTLTGQLASVIDALGNETCYTYDECDRLLGVQQYSGLAKEGIKTSGQTTTYERDLMGNITKITDALGLCEHYKYNNRSELIEKLDKEGYLTSYLYTKDGDVSKISYGDGRDVKFSYNAMRQLKEVEDWLGITKIDLNHRGQATDIIYPDGNKVSYTYGKAGERQRIVYPTGKEVLYEYDNNLRLKRLISDEQEIDYVYDSKGNLAEKTSSIGLHSYYTHNERGQLTELIHKKNNTILESFHYKYNSIGLKSDVMKQRLNIAESNGMYHYDYDGMGRLTEVKKNDEILRNYQYDAFGNRVSKKEENAEVAYSFNALNQLVSDGNNNYNYDKRGNLTEVTQDDKVINQYYFGAINRMEYAVNNVTGKASEYIYNGLGHRMGRNEGSCPAPALPTEKLADMKLQPTRHIDDVIDLTKEYHNLLQRSDDDCTLDFTWDNQVISVSDKDKSHLYIQDELGSPIRILNRFVDTEEILSYDEFGNIDNRIVNGEQIGDRESQPFTYTGYQQDNVSGTYFANAREYNPNIGRFISADIIAGYTESPISMNRYTYCFNSSMDFVDLNGAWPKWMKDAGKAISNGVKKAGNAVSDFVQSDVGKVVTTVGVIAVIGVASVVTGGTAGVILGATAAGALGGATIGGITNVITGGSFANGFVGGAIQGGVAAFGTALGAPYISNFVGGALGSGVTDYLDDPEISLNDLIFKSTLSGVSQLAFSSTIGKLFDSVKGDELAVNAILEYFKSVYDVGGSVTLEAIFQIYKMLTSGEEKAELCPS